MRKAKGLSLHEQLNRESKTLHNKKLMDSAMFKRMRKINFDVKEHEYIEVLNINTSKKRLSAKEKLLLFGHWFFLFN
jgi:hypothetical protein